MEKLALTVSGGRTSAYVYWYINTYLSDAFDITCVFSNTGIEHEETLIFVKKLEENFGVPIVWLEAVVHHGKRKSSSYKVVDFESAARNGEPFREMVKKYGLPNQSYPHCTRELKITPLDAYMKDHGIKVKTLGIRSDEMRRYKPSENKLYPLIEWIPATKEDILSFWEKQTFDLMIPEHYGNCVSCFKKSDKKLKTIAKEIPEAFSVIAELERDYSHMTTNGSDRKVFRGQMTSFDILKLSKGEFVEFADPYWGDNDTETCAEECGTIDPEYEYDSGGIYKGNT